LIKSRNYKLCSFISLSRAIAGITTVVHISIAMTFACGSSNKSVVEMSKLNVEASVDCTLVPRQQCRPGNEAI